MLPSRRSLLARLLAATGAGAVTTRAAAAGGPAVQKVAYHLADIDKVTFVLGNIENHIAGVGGPQNVKIELVVHGPALSLFQKAKASPDISRRLSGIAAEGVALAACGNTMKAQNIEVGDLLPGFVRVSEGGVVRLAQLQAEGYAYLRP